MKLSDYKGEEALDVLADIIEPLTVILGDPKMQELAEKEAAPVAYIKPILKDHKKEIIEVLARLENETVEQYKSHMTILSLPVALLSLINDPEVQNLFHSQEQSKVTSLASSGPAMENTEAEGN